MAFEPSEQTEDTSGPMGMDEAISLLDADDADLAPDEAADPAPADDEDTADDQAADVEDAPDDDDPASEGDEDDPEEDQAAEAISAPEFWSADEKAVFAKAPPEVQLLVAAKTAEAEKRVYTAKEEAAAARKDASIIAEVRQVVDQQLERAQSIFQGKWEGVDWAAWSRENPTEAFQAKLEHDQEQEELRKLQTAAAATEVEEHRQFLRDEAAKLAEKGHPLADPVKGKAEKQALLAYVQEQGQEPAVLKWAGAWELAILHKAMLYDRAQTRLATKPPAKQPPLEAKKPGPVRPAGPPLTRRETQAKQRKSVLGRAYSTGKMDDAVAALLAMES